MAQDQDVTEPNFADLSPQQVSIYAKEVGEHFREERRLRRALESRNRELEQRLRELTALNKMFQQHLSERFTVARAYGEVLEGIKQMANLATVLAEKAEAQRPPALDEAIQTEIMKSQYHDPS